MGTGFRLIEALETRKLLAGVTAVGEFAIGPAGNYYGYYGRQIDADANGNSVVVWSSGPGSSEVYARLFDPAGTPRTDAILVNGTLITKYTPNVAVGANGNFVVTWWDNDGNVSNNVGARLFNSAGAPLTPVFKVTADKVKHHIHAVAAMDDDGDFAIAWQGETGRYDWDTLVQRYSATGKKIGKPIIANTDFEGGADQYSPSVDMDADGDMVVTWQTSGQDGSGTGVFGRIVNRDGTFRGGEFRVNTHTAGNQERSQVAAGPAGEFTVVWQSEGQDGSGWGVYGQRYDAAGMPLSAEFRVNDQTAGDQTMPTVDVGRDGTSVIAWQHPDPDGSGTVAQAQAFDPSSATIGGNFQVNAAGEASAPQVVMQPNGEFVIGWRRDDVNELFGGKFIIL